MKIEADGKICRGIKKRKVKSKAPQKER